MSNLEYQRPDNPECKVKGETDCMHGNVFKHECAIDQDSKSETNQGKWEREAICKTDNGTKDEISSHAFPDAVGDLQSIASMSVDSHGCSQSTAQ